MDTHDLMARLHRVRAPGDFEAGVFAGIMKERDRRARRRLTIRYAFAGSAAVLLVGLALLNFLVLQKNTPAFYSSKSLTRTEAGVRAANLAGSPTRQGYSRSLVPVMETLDYSSEFRNASYQPKTVYILEQVSEGMPSGVKF